MLSLLCLYGDCFTDLAKCFVLCHFPGIPRRPAMSNFSIQQPFILCSSCVKSSSHWRMLWNTVIYFVSNLHPCCLRMGQNSWSRREHKRKNTAAATGALLLRTVGETGFHFSLNANQLVCLTPNSCSPETVLQLVWCIAVWLVVKCFPILTTAYNTEIFCFITKNYTSSFYRKAKRSDTDNVQAPAFTVLYFLPTWELSTALSSNLTVVSCPSCARQTFHKKTSGHSCS